MLLKTCVSTVTAVRERCPLAETPGNVTNRRPWGRWHSAFPQESTCVLGQKTSLLPKSGPRNYTSHTSTKLNLMPQI